MRLLSSKSGFKTARDLIFFLVGIGICIFHIVTTPAPMLSVPLLLFGAGLAGAPYVVQRDERKG